MIFESKTVIIFSMGRIAERMKISKDRYRERERKRNIAFSLKQFIPYTFKIHMKRIIIEFHKIFKRV